MLGENHPEVAIILSNLAVLDCRMMNLAAAQSSLEKAMEIRRANLGEDHPDFAESLHNLAGLYNLFAIVQSEILNLHQRIGNHTSTSAAPHLQAFLEILQQAVGDKETNFAETQNKVREYYATAKQYLQKALAIWQKVFGESHPKYLFTLNGLAFISLMQGDHTTAEPLFRQVIQIWQQTFGENHVEIAEILENLAMLYAATNRASEAMALMQRSSLVFDQLIGQAFSIGSESQRLAYLQKIRSSVDRFLSLVFNYLLDDPTAVQAAFDLILRRKGIGFEALAVQRDTVLNGRYPELTSQMCDLTRLKMQIAEKTLAGPGQEGLAAYQQLLAQWNAKKERLEAQLSPKIPEMNISGKLRQANRHAVAQALPEDSVLVEFVRTFALYNFAAVPARGESLGKSARYLAFILRAGEPDNVQMVDLGEAFLIDQMIAKFLASITGEVKEFNIADIETLLGEFIQRISAGNVSELETTSFNSGCDRSLSTTENIDETTGKFKESETTAADARGLGQAISEMAQKANASIGYALRTAIFDSLLSAIGSRKRLFLATDGDLTKLPFEVLPLDSDRHLIDEYHISYLSTGRDLLRFADASTGKPTDPLVAADPDFDLSSESVASIDSPLVAGRQSWNLNRNQNFQRLPGTKVEGEQIAAILNVKPMLAETVLETQLKACRSPRILHLATHGFFLQNQQRDLYQSIDGQLVLGTLSELNQSWMGRLSEQSLENPLLRSGLVVLNHQ